MLDRRENYGFLPPPPKEVLARAEQLRQIHARISCSARCTFRSNCSAAWAYRTRASTLDLRTSEEIRSAGRVQPIGARHEVTLRRGS